MQGHAGYKEIHHNKVAETSQHNKDVEHLMGTEILMLRIKNWKFQRIDHAADGIIIPPARSHPKPARGRLWKIGTKARTHSQPIPM